MFSLKLVHRFPISRSNRSQMFFEKDFLANFAVFTRKHICWTLFKTVKIAK